MDNNTFQNLELLVGFGQLKRTKQLNESVSKLALSIKDQERLLKQSNAINAAVLDSSQRQLEEIRRQTNLMEYEVKKRITSDLAKEAIFQLNQHLKYINSLSSNLEKYILSKNCFMDFQKKEIKFENISDITDKEYFATALDNLNKIANESIKNLSSNELSDLNNISLIPNKMKKIDEIKTQAKLSNNKIIEIKNKPPKELKEYIIEGSTKKTHFITSGRVSLLFILGLVMLGSFKGKPSNLDVFGTLSILISICLFLYILLRKAEFLIRDNFSKEKIEEKRVAMEKYNEDIDNIKFELIKNEEDEFKNCSHIIYSEISSSLDAHLDLDNYEDVLNQKKRSLDQLFLDTLKKYPAIDVSSV